MSAVKGFGHDNRRGEPSCTVQRLDDGTSIVRTTGEVSGDVLTQMHGLVADELLREPTQLVLAFAVTTTVDDDAVRGLVCVSGLAGERDISFCLVAQPTDSLMAALTAADLIDRFEIFGTIDEAVTHRSPAREA